MSQMDPFPPTMQSRPNRWQRNSGAFWGGGILILIGLYFLLANLGLLNWLDWKVVWPVILIALGVYLVVRRLR
jgi:Domain of unknown function (DUF5668)